METNMGINSRFLAVSMVLLASPCAFCAVLPPNTTVELGVDAWNFEYKEPGLMTERGYFVGAHGACTYRGPLTAALQDAMISADIRAGMGRVDYDGYLLDEENTPYSYDGFKDYLAEIRGLLGYDLGGPSFRLTPFLGAGYRYLEDDGTSSPYGYDRRANYLYSPLGVEALVRLNDRWQLGGTAEYDLFWFGRQKTLWGYWISDDQRNGYGLRGSARLIRQGRSANLIIEPYFIYWDIGMSEVNPSDAGYEPHNRSKEAGLRLTVQF
jgi:hypothetical protein